MKKDDSKYLQDVAILMMMCHHIFPAEADQFVSLFQTNWTIAGRKNATLEYMIAVFVKCVSAFSFSLVAMGFFALLESFGKGIFPED